MLLFLQPYIFETLEAATAGFVQKKDTFKNFAILTQKNLCQSRSLQADVCRCFSKQLFLKTEQYSQENTCVGISLFGKVAGLQSCNFVKKETLAQMFSCEFCKISKNTFFKEHVLVETACF